MDHGDVTLFLGVQPQASIISLAFVEPMLSLISITGEIGTLQHALRSTLLK